MSCSLAGFNNTQEPAVMQDLNLGKYEFACFTEAGF